MCVAAQLQSARLFRRLGGVIPCDRLQPLLACGLQFRTCAVIDHLELTLRLAPRPFHHLLLLVILRRRQSFRDFAHAPRHPDRFHEILLVGHHRLKIVQSARHVVQHAWHVEYFVAFGPL